MIIVIGGVHTEGEDMYIILELLALIGVLGLMNDFVNILIIKGILYGPRER